MHSMSACCMQCVYPMAGVTRSTAGPQRNASCTAHTVSVDQAHCYRHSAQALPRVTLEQTCSCKSACPRTVGYKFKMLGGTMTAAGQSTVQAAPRAVKPSVLVVGAGLIGASVAMHLARHGCPVTVLEAAEKPAAGQAMQNFAAV